MSAVHRLITAVQNLPLRDDTQEAKTLARIVRTGFPKWWWQDKRGTKPAAWKALNDLVALCDSHGAAYLHTYAAEAAAELQRAETEPGDPAVQETVRLLADDEERHEQGWADDEDSGGSTYLCTCPAGNEPAKPDYDRLRPWLSDDFAALLDRAEWLESMLGGYTHAKWCNAPEPDEDAA